MMHRGVIADRSMEIYNTLSAMLKKGIEKGSEGTFSPLEQSRLQSITKTRQKDSEYTDTHPDRKTMRGCMLPTSEKVMASRGSRVGQLSVGSGGRAVG